MKISLFCVFGLICLAGSHPTNQESNPVVENELEELELLLRQKLKQETGENGQKLYEEEKEREIKEEEEDEENDIEEEEEQEERKRKAVEEEELKEFIEQKNDKRANGQTLYEEEKRKLEKEREIKEEEEENDKEKEEEQEERKRKVVEEELKEFIEQENDKVSSTSHRYRYLPSHSLRRKMEERKWNERASKNNVRSQKAEPEELEIDDPKNVDPDSPLENLMEGMTIEENGKKHQVQGLHPEKSAKTYGDTHDGHKLIPEQQRGLASRKRRKRNFITNISRLWHKNVIPYTFFNMSSNSITVINQAIQQFTDTTCIRWVPDYTAGNYSLNHQNVVYFINEQGCWSYVGNVGDYINPKNIQKISLEEPGCISVSTSVHEMLHAMGGQHEQSRSDRDKYVEIGWANVQKGTDNNNMQKLSTQDNNPYDAESVMQYALYSFSTNGLRTIFFKDQRLEFLADSADGLEFYDIQDVTDAYHCADHCTNPPACQNGGFVNFQCICVCPDGLTGATCTDTVSNSATCGGVVTLGQGEEKFIQSPNYPSNYPTGLECTWLIKGTTGNLVRATVEYMDIAAGSACYHWLEYRYNLLGQKGPKRCGTNFNAGEEFWDSTSDELGNEMMIKFNSNQNSNNAGTTGFRLKVQSIGTGCEANPCAYGKCFSAEGTSTYTCTCDSGVSGQNCDVLSASSTIGCSFEYGEKCFLDNDSGDQFDWNYESDGTPTGGTGPTIAHGGYQFVYIEASSPRVPGDKAVLVNNVVTLTSGPRCLSFSYHMHGSNIGTLNVYIEGQNVAKSNVFTRNGQQGNNWLKGEVDVQAINNLKIYFEGVRGNGFSGDIALDDILLTPGTCATVVGPCFINPCQNGGTCSEATKKRMAAGYTCSCLAGFTGTECELKDLTTVAESTCGFENGEECVFENDEFADFNWKINDGTTPSSGTGPSSAYEGTYYIYIEASSPRVNGDTAILSTAQSKLAGLSPYCLQFYYHMLGNPDTLMVDLGERYSQGSTVWSVSGDQGDQWNYQQVEIDATTVNDPVISIAAVRGSSFQGDIAVDSLVLKMGSCPAIVTPCSSSPCKNGGTCQDATASFICVCAVGWTGPTCETISIPLDQYTCDFEDGETCIFVDSTQDDFDWTRKTGSTPSGYTGPNNAESGTYYMYTEASSPRSNGDVARLTTFGTTLQPSTYCLSLSYHMKGSPGSLSIAAGQSEQSSTVVWQKSGNQGDGWLTTAVDIPAFATLVINIEGSRGQSYKGDIAIDNLLLKKGSCPTVG